MIVKTTAIVLRVAPFSETSHVVTWLSPGYGKLATVVKGALRRSSPFAGQYDLFYTCELLFYERRHTEMQVAGECAALNMRRGLRADWRACARASYLTALVQAWLPPQSAQPHLFELLEDALDRLAGGEDTGALVPWFELRLLDLAGLAPRLRVCPVCRLSPAALGRAHWFFSSERGGVLCAACRRKTDAAAGTPIMPDVLGLLEFWQQAPKWDVARRMRFRPAQWRAAAELLGAFLRHHLGVCARARTIMMEISA